MVSDGRTLTLLTMIAVIGVLCTCSQQSLKTPIGKVENNTAIQVENNIVEVMTIGVNIMVVPRFSNAAKLMIRCFLSQICIPYAML